MYNGTTPCVRTLANGIESLIDTISDVMQAPPYVCHTLYLVYSTLDCKGKHTSHSTNEFIYKIMI